MSRVTGARAVASDFIAALDRNSAEEVRACFAEDATWWVDTGRDRAAGVRGHDPGDQRPWPLHGRMPADDKARLLAGLPSRYPDGLRQWAWNTIGTGPWVVIEVRGEGTHVSGRRYRNRYGFVIEVRGGAVVTVREYLDTLHAAAMFDTRGIDHRTEADVPSVGPPTAGTGAGRLALQLLAAITDGDAEVLRPLFAHDATWWADSGTDRVRGDQERVQHDPVQPFHGRISIEDKLASMAGIRHAFPQGLVLHPRRLVEEDGTAAVEVVGDAVHRSGRRYQNRYLFVLETAHDQIGAVREYCDTLHVADVFGVPVPV